jgi:hypothetical protein
VRGDSQRPRRPAGAATPARSMLRRATATGGGRKKKQTLSAGLDIQNIQPGEWQGSARPWPGGFGKIICAIFLSIYPPEHWQRIIFTKASTPRLMGRARARRNLPLRDRARCERGARQLPNSSAAGQHFPPPGATEAESWTRLTPDDESARRQFNLPAEPFQ